MSAIVTIGLFVAVVVAGLLLVILAVAIGVAFDLWLQWQERGGPL